MAGTVRGKIDCKHASLSGLYVGQEVFKNLYDLLNSHPNLTRKALYNGKVDAIPGADGNGTGFWDAPNAFGTGAFAVFTWGTTGLRPFTFDMLIQWTGQAPDPAALPVFYNGVATSPYSGEVGIAVAMSIGGDPWGGTTLNDGTDAKSNPVWVLGGGSDLIVLPASNSTGRTHGVAKSNMAVLFNSGGISPPRVSMLCDDDFFAFVMDINDAGTASVTTFVGPYTPDATLTVSRPMVLGYQSSGLLPADSAYLATYGGAVHTDSIMSGGHEAVAWARSAPTWATLPGHQPAEVTGYRREVEFQVICSETTRREFLGIVPGDFMRYTNNLLGVNTNIAKTRAYFSSDTHVMCLPWDGVTTPGTTMSRTGVTF